MRILLRTILGIPLLLIYLIGTLLIATTLLLVGAIAWAVPSRRWWRAVTRLNLTIPVLWAGFSNCFMNIHPSHRWNIQGPAEKLNKKGWYLIVANHRTWLDILVLGYVFNRKIPVIKFFMKKELLWQLPIVGLACWIVGYPFVSRHSRKTIRERPDLKNQDIDSARRACEKFREFPTSVVNFVEGTRLTTEKGPTPPYSHLLAPRGGGIALVSKELQDLLSGILNVTIHYSKPVTFWQYFRGDPCTITVQYELLPLTSDLIGDYYENREFRQYYQKWLRILWERKDQQLEEWE